MSFDILTTPLVRVVRLTGQKSVLTLPAVFAALVRDEIASFLGLRPHQRHAWHAFLVQLGTLALSGAGRSDPPLDEADWCDLLRRLTPDHPDDAPWCLVSPPDRPALLQPPLPEGTAAALKNVVETPDGLDMLVTAKNHDVKAEVMAAARPDDWLFALVTLQTMEGFLGAGNYGVSRMNGGFANRPAVGIIPPGGPGAHVRRDIVRLLDLRRQGAVPSIYPPAGGLGLVWLRPWDGTVSLRPEELDAHYIEICRRIRLFASGSGLAARVGGSQVPRIAPISGGVTGDPWAPVVRDTDGGVKVLTVDASGFGYRRMVRLILGLEGLILSPLQVLAENDAEDGLSVVARALVRGQGKTEGYHERRVPLSNRVRDRLVRRDTDPIARTAQDRVAIAGEIQGRVLKPALYTLFENGPDQIDFRDSGAERRASAFLKRFDDFVDRDFFPALWEEFEEGDGIAARRAWVAGLLRHARNLLQEADGGMSKAVERRYRALARAEAVFFATQRKSRLLEDYPPERSSDEAA